MLKPSSCQSCELYEISNGWIESEGEGSSGVVILGDKGGYNEYVDAKPFRPHGQGGSKLEEVFKLVAKETGQPCSRNQFLMYNVVNCNPPKDLLEGMRYEQSAISCCSNNVDRVVGGFRTNHAKTILALGNVPLKFLTGVSGKSEEKQSVDELRGFVFESKYGLVVPSLHPNFIRKGNNQLTPLLVEDLKRAMQVAKGTFRSYSSHPTYAKPLYQIRPSIEDAWSFYYQVKDSPRLPLTYDIETQETGKIDEDQRDDLEDTNIVLCQFSIQMGTGIALPWNIDFLSVIRSLFALPNAKANHNTWTFDNPRIRAKGIEIEGKVHDTMWMFKHWHPKLPRGLQNVASMLGFPFPWKHLYGADLPWYGCADVDAVQWILHYLPKLMKERGIWEGYKNHVYNVNPIMERATEFGIPVSAESRLEIEKDFQQRRDKVHGELQKRIPDELRDIEPKRKEWLCQCGKWISGTEKQCAECRYIRQEVARGEKWNEAIRYDYGYKREPKEVGECYSTYNSQCETLLREDKRVVSFERYLYRKTNLAYAEFERLDEVTGTRVTFERWAKIKDFDGSSQQVIKYLKWKQDEIEKQIRELMAKRDGLPRGLESKKVTEEIKELRILWKDYEVPVNLKSKKETTSKKEIEEIFFNTGDEILEMVMQIRSYETNLKNYIPNWLPSVKDGRVHPVYGYTAPQGQINSWKPNSQNVSKHTEFGNEFRGMIVAPKGWCFIEADKKSFHVGTMGYSAVDKNYIRFSQIDPHSILGSHIDPSVIGGSIDLKWSDSDILEAAREFKKLCKKNKEKDPSHNIDVRQELAKPTVLGNQLELGAKKLQRQNRRFIHSIAEAERLQGIMNDLFPKVGVYKKYVKEKAHTQKYLINEFGRIQYFYDVYQFSKNKRTGTWDRKEGSGARHPVAFEVQGRAFGMITEELLELEKMGVCEEHNFIVTIHDSLMFMAEESKKERCIEAIWDVMNRPCKKLVNEATGKEGLQIGVEIAVGTNWKRWNEESNLGGMREIKV